MDTEIYTNVVFIRNEQRPRRLKMATRDEAILRILLKTTTQKLIHN